MRVLIVEDEAPLANLLRLGLEEEGLGVDVIHDGSEALAAALTTAFDVITVDVMLPGGMDGFHLCRELRRRRVQTPILMLTARDAVELLARIRALARRHLEDWLAVLEAGDLRLDTAARELRVRGKLVSLTAKELAILECLMHYPRHVLSRSQIEEHVWSYGFEGTSNLVDVYIGRIRRSLAGAGGPDPIVTVRGLGYRFDPTPCASDSDGPGSG
jgi:two-component system OmpR family response regulator